MRRWRSRGRGGWPCPCPTAGNQPDASLPTRHGLAQSALLVLPPRGLLRHGDFRKLWFGETISLVGSQVTPLALQLTASILLQASPSQMGVLGASQTVPFLVLGLFAGVWVDRMRRRPIMPFG